MNIQLKDMKLIISRHGDTWDKVIVDMDNNVIFEQRGIKLFPEQLTVEYFDQWETQLRNIPKFNIVEVERFI